MEFIWAYGDMLLLGFSFVLFYQFQRFNQIVIRACDRRLQPRDIEVLRLFHWEIAKATKVFTFKE